MEVDEQESRTTAWERLDREASRILMGWLPSWLECKARGAIASRDILRPEHVEATHELAEKHLTDEQWAYAQRVFRDTPATFPGSWPWPAPPRVPRDTIRLLILCLQAKEMTSPKAWAAVRILSAVALIDAARDTMDAHHEAST